MTLALRSASLATLALAALLGACDDGPCETQTLPSRHTLGCRAELAAQAARPLDSSLPGAFTVKTIIDQAHEDEVHFQDTTTYPLHRAFAVAHLGWPEGAPFVDQYYLPQRRFLLGAITYYEGPGVWTYEIAPYDSASAEMIAKSFRLLRGAAWFGGRLQFHPTSEEMRARAQDLPGDIPVITTEEIYDGIDYQPLNLGETVGQVRVLSAADLATEYVGPREIAVLDRVPNDISVVAAIVTEEFQTPLSHVNVLSQQRRTPNMALRDARGRLGGFVGRWVRLRVSAFDWSAEPVTAEEADAWWQTHGPPAVQIPPPDLSRTLLADVDSLGLADVRAYGGKAAHFGELRHIPGVLVRDGFAIPVYYYQQFMQENGFDAEIDALLADPRFQDDGVYRNAALAALRARMRIAPVDPGFEQMLVAKLIAEFPGRRMRFRSSTNAEDLNGFSGAGLYDSESGELDDPLAPVLDAVRKVWSSLWRFRAFEERAYVRIDHHQAMMAILVIPTYVDETANGVAITANLFDPGPGGEDAFYVNAQLGEASVVAPDPGVRSDQFLYFFFHNGQPATYFTRSSLVPAGTTVLTRRELFELGTQLDLVRRHFASLYPRPDGYAQLPMDVEWKRVGSGRQTRIEIKQARPHPGRGR